MGEVADDVNEICEIWERWDWVRHGLGVLGVQWQQLAVMDIGAFCLVMNFV